MENNETALFAAGGVLNGIAYLLIIVACVVLVLKRRTGPTILMLISQILALFFFVGSFAWTAFSARQGTEELVNTSKILALLGPLPHMLFAAGLLWFAVTLAQKEHSGQ